MSRTDFEAYVADTIRAEQQATDTQFTAGATFTRSSSEDPETLEYPHFGHDLARQYEHTSARPTPHV
ncbi:hypothetical protein C5B94_03320 [Clavibacter michiganensis]|nr:hypothetical protein C5B94_03320 [Clavibacter michiganensis]